MGRREQSCRELQPPPASQHEVSHPGGSDACEGNDQRMGVNLPVLSISTTHIVTSGTTRHITKHAGSVVHLVYWELGMFTL